MQFTLKRRRIRYSRVQKLFSDGYALGGVRLSTVIWSCAQFSKGMPRACPVESHVRCYLALEREPPRLKAVASSFVGWQNQL
jgi:hypothetical protein